MNLTDVRQLSGQRKWRKRVGRGPGSGHGKTSGRGHKGCRSRAGRGPGPLDMGGQLPLFRRLPKFGFSNAQFTRRYAVVNVGDLDAVFQQGDMVDAAQLRKKRLVRTGADVPVKILGDGELTKQLTVRADKFSKSAQAKIAAAGGTCEIEGQK